MKGKDIGTSITTNDHHVRLRIFDGVIPADDYWREMHEAEAGQHKETRRQLDAARARLKAMAQ